MSIRWRVNAHGAQWFFNGHWHSCNDSRTTLNLFGAVEAVTASYPARRIDAEEAFLLSIIGDVA